MRKNILVSAVVAALMLACLACLLSPTVSAEARIPAAPAPEDGLYITSPENGTSGNVTTLTVSWQVVSPGPGLFYFLVKVDDGAWINNSQRTSITLISLEEGWHLVQVQASNELGSYYADRVEFEVDTLPPSITSRSPTGSGAALSSEIMVYFSEDMDRGSVQIQGAQGTLTWGARGFVLTPYEALAPATNYTIEVTGLDLAGNHLVGGTWSFNTTDKGSIAGKVKDDRNYTVEGVEVKVLKDGAVIASTTTDSNGNFNVEAPQGSYNLSLSSPKIEARTLQVNVSAGETLELGVVKVERAPDYTWVAIDVVIVLGAVGFFFVGRRRDGLKPK